MGNNKVYVNVAPTLLYGGNTGIQRVVRELERYLDQRQVAGRWYEFGGLFSGQWVKIKDFQKSYSGSSPHENRAWQSIRHYVPQHARSLMRRVLTRVRGRLLQGGPLPAGSVLLDIDAGWIDEWKTNYTLNLRRVTLIYDLIPYSHPQFCTSEHNENFQRWLNKTVTATDAVIAISKSAMEATREYAAHSFRSRIKRYGYFHLGCDFSVAGQGDAVSLPEVLQPGRFFLIVGTIEPRKNHRLALQAFDAYRRAGGGWNMAIVGRAGWSCNDIVADMTASPYYGKELQWFSNADDILLARLYQDAGALIIPSHIEGFGLPLVEGAHWGCPIIASDIPVFREIGEDFANFFAPTDASKLEEHLWNAERGSLPKSLAEGQAVGLSWQQSAMQFAEEIAHLLKD